LCLKPAICSKWSLGHLWALPCLVRPQHGRPPVGKPFLAFASRMDLSAQDRQWSTPSSELGVSADSETQSSCHAACTLACVGLKTMTA